MLAFKKNWQDIGECHEVTARLQPSVKTDIPYRGLADTLSVFVKPESNVHDGGQ